MILWVAPALSLLLWPNTELVSQFPVLWPAAHLSNTLGSFHLSLSPSHPSVSGQLCSSFISLQRVADQFVLCPPLPFPCAAPRSFLHPQGHWAARKRCFAAPTFIEMFAFLCGEDSHRPVGAHRSTRPDPSRHHLQRRKKLSPQPPFGCSRSGCGSSGWVGGWSFWSVFPVAGIHLGRLYHSRRLCMYLTRIRNANEGTQAAGEHPCWSLIFVSETGCCPTSPGSH